MSILGFLYLAAGFIFFLFFTIFSIEALREKRRGAAEKSATIAAGVLLLWAGEYYFINSDTLHAVVLAGAFIFTALFFLPIGRKENLETGQISERIDERDTMFARAAYKEGSDRYEEYYRRRPELKEIDDKIRKCPKLLEPGGKLYDPAKSNFIKGVFELEENLANYTGGPVSDIKVDGAADYFTEKTFGYLKKLGANEMGIARLNPMYVYSHVGKGPGQYGQPIENKHRFVICFSAEMNYFMVENAPQPEVTEETAIKYVEAQKISISLANWIRCMGYPARAHVSGSDYQIILPAAAYDAGIGEIGRMGYLISPKYGGRIRLGAVTTDLPLLPAEKTNNFGVQDFCRICKKCAENCPSGSISYGAKEEINGVKKWPVNVESCYYLWRKMGTDCALCMKSCPFSHPDTLMHKILRVGIKNSAFARRLSLWGDDYFYGRKYYSGAPNQSL